MSHPEIEAAPYGKGRLTSPRRAIARAVESMSGAFSVEELVAAVRSDDPSCAAPATVYRAIAAMEASGFIEKVGAREGAALFAHCAENSHHHHHIVCDGCGRTAPTACSLSTHLIAVEETGFVVTRHEMTIYGLCPSCARGHR